MFKEGYRAHPPKQSCNSGRSPDPHWYPQALEGTLNQKNNMRKTAKLTSQHNDLKSNSSTPRSKIIMETHLQISCTSQQSGAKTISDKASLDSLSMDLAHIDTRHSVKAGK